MNTPKLPKGSVIITVIVFAVALAILALQVWIEHRTY